MTRNNNYRPWRWWHTFGLLNSQAGGVQPWTLFHHLEGIFKTDFDKSHAVDEEFDHDAFSNLVTATFLFALDASTMYATVLLALAIASWLGLG